MKQNTWVVLKSYAKKFRFMGPTADGSNLIHLDEGLLIFDSLEFFIEF